MPDRHRLAGCFDGKRQAGGVAEPVEERQADGQRPRRAAEVEIGQLLPGPGDNFGGPARFAPDPLG